MPLSVRTKKSNNEQLSFIVFFEVKLLLGDRKKNSEKKTIHGDYYISI